MPQMFNRATQSLVDVPDASVPEALLSGNFGLLKGSRVPVVSPDGKFGTVPAESAADAFRQGFTYEGDGARAKRLEEQDYATRKGEAFLAGAARGLTFGLSDVGLTESGLASDETLRKLREYHPAVSIGGEIAGALGPMAVETATGVGAPAAAAQGAGLAAKAVRGVGVAAQIMGALPKAVVGAGRIVENAADGLIAARAISNPVAQAIVKTLPRVAGAATEGAFYGAGQAVSEEALGDPALGAEKTMADVGLHVLLGAGKGAALGAGATAALSSATGVAKLAKQQFGENLSLARARDAVQAFGERQAVKSLGPTKKWTERAMAKTGGLEQMGRDLLDDGIVTAKDTLDSSAKKLGVQVQQLGEKIGGVYRTLDDFARTSGAMDFERTVGAKAAAQTDELLQLAAPGAEATAAAARALPEAGAAVGRGATDVGAIAAPTSDALSALGQREVGAPGAGLRFPFEGAAPAGAGPKIAGAGSTAGEEAAGATIGARINVNKQPTVDDFLSTVYREAVAPLKDRPPLAPVYKKLNGFLTEYGRIYKDKENISFGQIFDIRKDIDKTIKWNFSDLADTTLYNQNATNMRWAIQNYLEDKASKMLEQVRPTFIQDFRELNRKFSSLKMAEDIADSSIAAGARNRFFSLTDHLAAVMTGAASSSFLIGLGTAAINKFIIRERGNQILAGTADRIAKLGLLQRAQGQTDSRIRAAIGSILSGEKISRGAARTTTRSFLTTPLYPDSTPEPTSKPALTNRRIAELSRLRNDPEEFAARVSAPMQGLGEHAPETFAAMTAKTTQAVDYLLQNAPRPTQPDSPLSRPWTPDPVAISRWERIARGVLDPLVILDDAAAGRLSHETAQAVRDVYPEMYSALVQQALEQIAGHDGPLSYATRMQLSVLLGQAVDQTTSPQFTAAMQRIYAPPQASEPVQVPNPSRTVALSRANKLHAQQHAITDVQRVSG